MTKKKEREASQLDFDYTQAEKFNKIVTTKLEDANYEVQNGIAEFEAKLKAMGHKINPAFRSQGDVHAVAVEPGTNMRLGWSDGRRGGHAIGY